MLCVCARAIWFCFEKLFIYEEEIYKNGDFCFVGAINYRFWLKEEQKLRAAILNRPSSLNALTIPMACSPFLHFFWAYKCCLVAKWKTVNNLTVFYLVGGWVEEAV